MSTLALWTLVQRFWKQGAILVLIAVLLTVYRGQLIAAKRAGIAEERIRSADSTIAVLEHRIPAAETVYVRDTIRIRTTVPQLLTLHDTVVQHLTDTVLVLRYVTAADSALHACSDLVSSCETTRRLLTADRNAWKSKYEALTSIPPPVGRSLKRDALLAGGGALTAETLRWLITLLK